MDLKSSPGVRGDYPADNSKRSLKRPKRKPMGKNFTSDEKAVLNSVARRWRRLTTPTKIEKEPLKVLSQKLRSASLDGKKTIFWWNGIEIRYFVFDCGNVDVKYVCANPKTGCTTTLRVKDFVGKNGNIKFSSIAKKIKLL